jgi:hypothetical protein
MEGRISTIKTIPIFLAGVLVTHLYTRRRERKPEQLAPVQSAAHRHLTTMVTALLRDGGISVPGEQPSVAERCRAVDQVINPTGISPGVAVGTPTMVRLGEAERAAGEPDGLRPWRLPGWRERR